MNNPLENLCTASPREKEEDIANHFAIDSLPPGTRIIVRAGPGEGSDCEFDGRHGEIVRWHGCSTATVLFDKPPRGWPNPYCGIVGHNLRRE